VLVLIGRGGSKPSRRRWQRTGKAGTWSKIKLNDKKRKAVTTQFVLDIKHDAEGNMTRYKARLVAQGFNQVPGRDLDETWAPVLNPATTRSLFAVAASTEWEVHHADINTAFLNAKSDKEMYIKLPDGVHPKGLEEMCRLNLALYGTNQARRLRAPANGAAAADGGGDSAVATRRRCLGADGHRRATAGRRRRWPVPRWRAAPTARWRRGAPPQHVFLVWLVACQSSGLLT